jgi:hypothetical protein
MKEFWDDAKRKVSKKYGMERIITKELRARQFCAVAEREAKQTLFIKSSLPGY